MKMSEKKGSKKARSKDLTPKLSKDELLRRLKVSMQRILRCKAGKQ